MKHIKIPSKTPPLEHGRGADRFNTTLPVEIAGTQGLTRNISATGIYFEVEMAQELGACVRFTVEMNLRGEKLKLVCEGQVVRVDRNDRGLGIAAQLVSSFFPDAAEVINVKPGSLSGRHLH